MLVSTSLTVNELRADGSYRHWSPESEPYAPAVVLLQYLRLGWRLDNLVGVETFFCSGYLRCDVYYFTLQSDTGTLEIPVLANPAVFKVVESHHLTIVRINVDRPEPEHIDC